MNRIVHITNVALRISSKRFFALLGRLNRQLQPYIKYGIKKGYHHAGTAAAFDDRQNTDEWQKEVYQLALARMQQQQYTSVIDAGCGSAYKLVHLLGNYETTGIEVNPTYEWLLQQYPGRKWVLFDKADPLSLQADLVICSDVVEHLANPDILLKFLQSIRFSQLIISTPEREAVAGTGDYGPPENTAHYREWNATEFNAYISQYFTVQEQLILPGRSVTQVVICTKKK